MRRLTYANVMATIAVVFAVGGGGYAIAQTGSKGTIKGCTNKKTGVLRVLKAKAKCKRSERAIAWNIQGPAGRPGPGGSTGQPGSNGPAGTSGATGPRGADGTL